jgi:hypothetical protein
MSFIFFRILFVLALPIFFAGCATDPKAAAIKDQNISLMELTHIVKDFIPGGAHVVSANGREYTSEKFIIVGNEYKPSTNDKVRYTCKIEIVNSSRPFNIVISAFREVLETRRGTARYLNAGEDLRVANLLKQQLRDRLAKRRDDLNFLDDFKVF